MNNDFSPALVTHHHIPDHERKAFMRYSAGVKAVWTDVTQIVTACRRLKSNVLIICVFNKNAVVFHACNTHVDKRLLVA